MKFLCYKEYPLQSNSWEGLIRIDGILWQWMGGDGGLASTPKKTSTQMSFITPTRTVFELLAGPIVMNITFFSPIEVRVSSICRNIGTSKA
jgi:hypothetical protein